MWHSSTDTPPPSKKFSSRCTNLSYLSSGLVVSLCRRDIISALVSAGCHHLAIDIFNYLDSSSLLACSLVCSDWQRMLLGSIYTTSRFRKKVRSSIFGGKVSQSQIVFSLDMETKRTAVIDVAVDDDFNIFALGVFSGRAHVMACSLFGLGKKRWVHRFNENIEGSNLSCISSGQSLVAIGMKDGKINLYECNQMFRNLRLTAVLAHHSRSIRSIIFAESRYIITCSDDMTIGIVAILPDGSLQLTKLLHGHVSRIRAIDVQSGKILSGSDDRSVKLWSLRTANDPSPSSEKPINTLTGHSGPVTIVQLSLPYALSTAGSTVRLWDVDQGTCLKLLQHEEDCPVTSMTWISTFKGVATVDMAGRLRCFDLFHLETANQEIVVASSCLQLNANGIANKEDNGGNSIQQNYSPPQNLKNKSNISDCKRPTSNWPDQAVIKLESIPHHFSAFSISNEPLPAKITVHCLDYIL